MKNTLNIFSTFFLYLIVLFSIFEFYVKSFNNSIIDKMENDNIHNEIKGGKSLLDAFLDTITKTPVFLSLLTVLIVAVYGQSLNFDYTYLDDKVIISDNLYKTQPLFSIKEAFSRDAFFSKDGLPFYRPLQNLSYMIDAVAGGKNQWMFHVTNILLHVLTCFSVFYLFILLKNDRKTSALIAAIYAIHPLFTHAVAWIPSRGDLLVALFGILSYIAFLKYIETKKYYYLIINGTTFALAMFSKETAILLPLIYSFHFLYVSKKRKIEPNLLIVVISWIAVAVAFMMARNEVIIPQIGDESFGINSVIKNLPTLPEIITKFFIPINLSTMPKFTSVGTSIGIVIMIALLAAILFSKTKKWGLLLLGVLWFLLFAVPPMAYRHNYADFGYEYFEHRAYLPMIGMFIILLELYRTYKVRIKPKVLLSVGLLIILLFSTITFVNANNYRNIASFFGRAISLDPKNALGNYNWGNYYKEKQKAKLAAYYLERAVKANPEYLEAYQNLADVYNYQGRRPEAIQLLTKSIKVNDHYYAAWKFLGMLYGYDAKYEKALESYRGGLRLRQKDNELYVLMGNAYLGMGKKDSAELMFKKSLELKPNDKQTLVMLGNLYKDMGNLSKSSELLEKTKTSGKESVDSYITLGEVYGRQGNFDKSLEALEKALKLDPKNARVHNNIGTAYAIQKKYALAAGAFEKACQFDENNSSYWFNLGLAYNDMKQRSKAISAIKKSASLGYPIAKQWLADQKVN